MSSAYPLDGEYEPCENAQREIDRVFAVAAMADDEDDSCERTHACLFLAAHSRYWLGVEYCDNDEFTSFYDGIARMSSSQFNALCKVLVQTHIPRDFCFFVSCTLHDSPTHNIAPTLQTYFYYPAQ